MMLWNTISEDTHPAGSGLIINGNYGSVKRRGESGVFTNTGIFMNSSQYENPKEFLLHCISNNDIEKWNKFRENDEEKIIELTNMNFRNCNLDNINLSGAILNKSIFNGAIINNSDFSRSDLSNTTFFAAKSENTNYYSTKFCDSDLSYGYFLNCNMKNCDFENSELTGTKFIDSELIKANLQKCNLNDSILYGSDISFASLQDANLHNARVNYKTNLDHIFLSKKTDMRCINYSNAQYDGLTLSKINYIIRRKNWEEHYKDNKIKSSMSRLFWHMSDYGFSTIRIVSYFAIFIIVFSAIYFLMGFVNPPGVIDNLFVVDGQKLQSSVVILRSIYFSFVTMTTLGFGDIYVSTNSYFGYFLVVLQTLLGYFMLGAIITRLAILFSNTGPAKFDEYNSKLDSTSANTTRGQVPKNC